MPFYPQPQFNQAPDGLGPRHRLTLLRDPGIEGCHFWRLHGDLLDTLPTTVEGRAAVVGVLAHQQQALRDDVDAPELVSPFRSAADAFLFVQTLDEALTRMLARQRKPEPAFDGRLSPLFTDPMVRAAFARAERDQGEPAPAPIVPEPRPIDGAAVRVFELA